MKSDFVKEMSLHDYCLYIAQCNEALPAEPFSLAEGPYGTDDEAAVVEAETAASVHYPVQPEKHYTRNN